MGDTPGYLWGWKPLYSISFPQLSQTHRFTFHLPVCFCWHIALMFSVFLCVCFLFFFAFSLLHTLTDAQKYTCRADWEYSVRIKDERERDLRPCQQSCASGGKKEKKKKSSFGKLTAPFRMLHLLHHKRPGSFSTLTILTKKKKKLSRFNNH